MAPEALNGRRVARHRPGRDSVKSIDSRFEESTPRVRRFRRRTFPDLSNTRLKSLESELLNGIFFGFFDLRGVKWSNFNVERSPRPACGQNPLKVTGIAVSRHRRRIKGNPPIVSKIMSQGLAQTPLICASWPLEPARASAETERERPIHPVP